MKKWRQKRIEPGCLRMSDALIMVVDIKGWEPLKSYYSIRMDPSRQLIFLESAPEGKVWKVFVWLALALQRVCDSQV